MPETKYDTAVLQKYADDLYSQARWVIFSATFIYGLVTFVVSFLLVSGLDLVKHPSASVSIQPGLLMLAVIGGAVGFWTGRKKAFSLKLEAQKTLCQRQVELNTRSGTKPEVMGATAGR